jgi:adenine-specific DNA-methyltransferase
VKRDHAFAGEDARKLAAWDPFDPNAFAPFFDGEWMFGLDASSDEGWFDIAFANPPYIRQEKIQSFQINGKPVVSKSQLKEDYETFSGTADIYVYFYERALRLLKPKGALAFITSNKWHRAGYGKGLREWLSTHARILKIIDFGDAPVFEAIAYPTVLVATRKAVPSRPLPSETIQVLNWTPVEGEDVKESVKRFPERFAAEAFAIPQAELSAAGWQLEPPADRNLLATMRNRGRPLGDWCEGRFYYGVKTGLNQAFVVDGVKRAELIAADPKSEELMKPYIAGQDVKRWFVETADQWLIFIPWHFPLHDDPSITGASERAEREFRRQYPAIYSHLCEYKTALTARAQSEVGVRYEWYALQRYRPNYWREFAKPKIVYPDIYLHQRFAYDVSGSFGANTTYFIPTDARWLTAVLNSNAVEWFYRAISTSIRGGYMRAFSQDIQRIPVPQVAPEQATLLTIVVDAILAGAEQTRVEALVNALVYELFFPDELHARKLYPFATARDAGLGNLADLEGAALGRAVDEWSRCIADPASPLYATIFDLQSIDSVRIIEGSA